jgi:hypothetical protein
VALIYLDLDLMNLPAGAGSTLDGAALCRASKGRASAKGRGRARGTARLDDHPVSRGVGLAGPALAVPSAPTANSLTGSTSAMPTQIAVLHGARQVHLDEVIVPARPLPI